MQENKEDFKSTVKYRMAKLNITQNELAEKLGISYPYLSDILISKRNTPRVSYLKDKIVAMLDELESGCLIEK